jgi:hypothetical protein
VGTAADPRPEVARRVQQITRQQERATNDLETARNRLARATTAATRAEEQLIERSQRRTRPDSQAQRNIENTLNRSRAAASAATDQIGQLSARLRSLGREFAAIQRTSPQALIPGLGELINANQIASTQRSIRALAQEFNRLGDSAMQSTAERALTATFIPNQIRQFEQLSDQLAASRTRAQALREQLIQIGRNERLIPITIDLNLPDLSGEVDNLISELAEVSQAQQEYNRLLTENDQIRQRNQQRQSQRSELRTQIGEENALIGQLETQAVEAGREVDRLQRSLADLVEFRYRDEPRTGLNISLNQIQAQAESLALVANNSSIASREFRQYTVAAEVASIKLARSQQESFRALAAGLSTPLSGVQLPEGLRSDTLMAGARGLVGQVLGEMPTIATGASNAALNAYVSMLQSLQGLVPMLSNDYRLLADGIARANEEISLGTGRPDPAQRRINAELSRQADIENRINEANLTIGQQEVVRNRLAEARVALEERGVEAAREQTSGLTRQINAMQSINRAQERRNSAVEDELSLLEGRIGRIQRSDLPDDIKTVLTSRGNQAIDLLVGGPGVDPDLEGARRVRKELERDRIAAEKDYRSTLSVSEARSNQIGKILKLEQELNKIRLSGHDTAAQDIELGRIKDALTSNTVQLNKQLISDSSIALDRVADYVTQQRDGIRVTNEQIKNTEKQNKANQDLITKSNTLKIIQSQYNELKAKGISFGEEELELQSLISQVDSGQYDANEKNIRTLDTLIKKYTSFAALKQQDLRDMERWQQKGGPALPAVNRVVGPTSAINEPERIQDLLQRARIQQQALLGLQIKGRDVTQEQSEIQQLINELEGRSTNLKGKGANLSQKLREDVERELNIGDDRIRLMNGQMNIMGQVLSLEDSFIEKRNRLNSLLLKYNELKKQGVQFQGADVELETLVNSISGALSTTLTKDFVDDLGRRVKAFQSTQSRSVQEAVAAGTFTGTTQTPEKLEKERNRQLREAYGLRKTLDDLEKKGIASDLTRVDLLQQINTLEQRRGQIAADNLIAVQAELETTGRVLDVTRTEIARLKSDIEETSKATGFGKSFQDFQEALKGSRTFFGIENPAEAIDKIVREFNKDVQRAAVADAAPVQTAIRTEDEQMLDSFRNQFANLTTNPRFFGRLLSQIPDDALTTSMAGAATDMATRGRTTTGVLTGIGKIPGGLESQIESAYQDAFGRVPGGVTRLFDKIASVFDALVGRRFSGAGLGGSGGGVRPPSGPGGGAGGAGGPGNFGDRLTDAEAKGVGALLGLQELQKPSEVATVRLEILSNVLKDVYSQLDPTSEDAKRFNSALRRTTARLDEIVASRAPDADPLVRLTRSPRMAQGISEGLIGGAFPLLFGQGAGGAVLGGAGGFAGGFMGGALGFGLSLIGTALGTAFDTAVQSAAELGGALNDTAKAFDMVRERSLFSSKEVEKLASKLEEAGFSSAASILAQQEVINKIGGSGVQRLRDLGESSDRLSRAWAEFNLQLQAALAGPMAGLLEWVAGIVGASNRRNRQEIDNREIFQGLSEVDKKAANQKIQKEISAATSGIEGPAIEQIVAIRTRVLEEFKSRSTPSATSSVEISLDEGVLERELKTALESTSSVLSQELELLNIGKGFSDQFRNAIREQEDINEQAFEIRKSYEESIRDIRLGIERTVQKEALDGLRAQSELAKLQGETRLQQLRNANTELVSAQGADEYGKRLFEILGRAAELELSSQQNIENRKRDLELDLQAKAIETEIYKADIAKQVASLNESSAKSIANINKSIRRSNEDYDERKFGIEKKIASIRLQLMNMENERAISDVQRLINAYENLAPGQELNDLGKKVLEDNKSYLKLLQSQESPLSKAQKAVADAQPPAKKAEVAPISTTSVSLAAFDAVRERAVAAVKAISEAQEGLAALAKQGEWMKIKDELLALADQGFAQATKQLDVFIGRFRDVGISGFGDELSAPLEELERRRLDLEALFKTEQTEGSEAILEQYKKAGLDERQAAGLVELGIEVTKLSKNQLEGVRTAQYYLDSASDLTQEFESLSDQLREATQFGTQYEKTLASLVSRGLDPATEASRALLAEAEKIDILRQKVAVVEGFAFAADTLSGSMKDLVLQFAELGSASAAVKKVSDELGKKAFGFILDLAFKPVEENMRKSMLDMATKLGFDISTPQERQLKELESIKLSNNGILENLQTIVQRYIGTLPTAAPAVSTVPPNSSRLLQTQGGLRTPEELALRDITPKTNVPVSQQVDAPVPGSFRPVSDPKDYGRQYVEYQRQMLEYRRQLQNYNSPGMTIKYPPLSPGSNKYGIDYNLPQEKTNRGADSWPMQNRTVGGPQGGSYDQMPLVVPMNGIGGPDPGTREPYPVPQNQWMDNTDSSPPKERVDEGGIPVPGSPTLRRAQEELKRTTEAINQVGASAAQAIPPLQGWDLVTKGFMGSVDETTVHFEDATQRMSTVVPQWGKSLGQVVTGIGMASTAIIGIVGGIQNIRKGGAGNIFSGIGSILTTVGGLGMSIAGMGLFRGGGSGAFPTGNFNFLQGSSPLPASFGFANGGVFEGDILDSPKLFNFEDAGVTKSGQAGEAGTEAIMPLSRTKDGRLGVSAELSIPFEMTDLIAEDDPEGADPEFTGASASSTGGRGAAGAAGALSVPFSRMGRRGSGMTAAQAMRAAAELGLSIPFVSNGDTAQAETTAGGADEVIRFESTVINGQEFVTREEAEKIGRVAAVKGADLARRRVRNNPQERRLQGIQ